MSDKTFAFSAHDITWKSKSAVLWQTAQFEGSHHITIL